MVGQRPLLLLVAGAFVFGGCLGAVDDAGVSDAPTPPTDPGLGVVAHDAKNQSLSPFSVAVSLPLLAYVDVGARAPEPSIGVTSNGMIFFQGNHQVPYYGVVAYGDEPGVPPQWPQTMRSDDGGLTWRDVAMPPFTHPTSLDPFLLVDPDTDRVFVDSLWVGCSYLSYSDDYGDTWVPNPIACGNTLNDHQKLAVGKYRPGAPLSPTGYPNVVYFGYNQFFGNDATGASRISMSYDGGLTWPVNRESIPAGHCSGGLHGRIRTDSEGRVFIPKRDCDGTLVGISQDSGYTWDHVMVGQDVGSTEYRKNHEMAIDREDNVYLVWAGPDQRLYLSISRDHGRTWSNESMIATPPEVTTATMPSVVAGDAGRIAFTYYGVWEGNGKNPECVGDEETWDVYVTWSLDALSENPTFLTVRANDPADPVQIGGISTLGLQVPEEDLGPGCTYGRNLADFIDMTIDADGRVYSATADGCAPGCATIDQSRGADGYATIQVGGPSLFSDVADFEGRPTGAAG